MKLSHLLVITLLACGCASVPRYAERTTIPSLRFSQTPVLDAIDQLSSQIMAANPELKGIEIDRTPPKVLRPKTPADLTRQMDELQTRYLVSLPTDFGETFVTFWADNISVREACFALSWILSMKVVYRPDSIAFRFLPETAVLRTYPVTEGMVEALKNHTPPADGSGFRLPPIWNDNVMMCSDDQSTILLIGSEDDHIAFEKELKKREHNNPSHHTAGSRANAQPPAAGER